MFVMDHPNTTQSLLAVENSGSVTSLSEKNGGSGNEYFYILIVMTFYGIFLMGIMLGNILAFLQLISECTNVKVVVIYATVL
uniref:Uncharacterized protein n=1 Tax=Laticauda laticaudata TaxID=8630 RepID=A0A8C5WN23_LATLA